MLLTLRVVRAFLGFVFVMQVMGLMPAITWLTNFEQVPASVWAFAAIKAVIGLLAAAGYQFLQGFINGRHARNTGSREPLLRTSISL